MDSNDEALGFEDIDNELGSGAVKA